MTRPNSTKPYFIRAIHEWCVDEGYTPYVSVAVDGRTRVPQEYVKNGQIVLNLSPDATHQLTLGNEVITFSARFNGVAQALSIPVDNVAAVYASENGQGIAFEVTPAEDAGTVSPASEPENRPTGSRPHLTRIK